MPSDSLTLTSLLKRHRLALSVLAVTAVAYAAGASRYVQGGDNGEFATIFADGGVAHPSGYPLYSLWLRVFCWLPAVTPAHGAALATALLALLANLALYAAMLAWSARPAPAAVMLAVFALSREQWLLATSAEVFEMNNLVAATALLLSGQHGPVRGHRRAATLAVVAGLVPAAHLTAVLLAPCFGIGLWRATRESSVRATLLRLPLGLLGLLPFLYLPWAASAPKGQWIWGEQGTVGMFFDHVLRREYGTFTLSPSGDPLDPGSHLLALGWELILQLWGAPLLLLCLCGYLARREDRRELVRLWPVAASFLLAGPLFVSLFNIPLRGIGPAVVARFYVLPSLLLVCLLSVLLTLATEGLERNSTELTKALAIAGILGGSLGINGAFIRRINGPIVERYLVDTLESLPKGALLIGSNDMRLFGILYLQRARSIRTDVVHVPPALMMRSWYRARVSRALSLPIKPPVGNNFDGPGLVDQGLAAGRSVFTMDTDALMLPILDSHPNYPLGTTVRLLRPGEPEPTLSVLLAMNEAWFAAHPAPTDPPPTEARWERMARWDYVRPLRYLAGELTQQGQQPKAFQLLELAQRIVGEPLP